MRPLNLGDTLDASMKIVGARWRTLATVMLVIALPIQIATVIIVSATTDTYQVGHQTWAGTASADSATTYSDEGTYAAGQVAILALGFLGYLLGTVACYRAIAQEFLGRATSAGESLRFAGDRLGAALTLTLLLVAGLIVAFLALIVPGIWLGVAWSVALPVLLVEGIGGTAAMQRSFALVKGLWWPTLGRLVVAYIMVAVFSAIVSAIFLAIADSVVDDTSFLALVVESASNLVVSLVTTPFIAAVITLVYFDLRVRKEGFDVRALAPDGEPPVGVAGSSAAPSASGRDAFGNPVVPRPAPAPVRPPGPAAPRPGDLGPDRAAPEGWAPPQAPEPRRRPLWDPGPPDPERGDDRQA